MYSNEKLQKKTGYPESTDISSTSSAPEIISLGSFNDNFSDSSNHKRHKRVRKNSYMLHSQVNDEDMIDIPSYGPSSTQSQNRNNPLIIHEYGKGMRIATSLDSQQDHSDRNINSLDYILSQRKSLLSASIQSSLNHSKTIQLSMDLLTDEIQNLTIEMNIHQSLSSSSEHALTYVKVLFHNISNFTPIIPLEADNQLVTFPISLTNTPPSLPVSFSSLWDFLVVPFTAHTIYFQNSFPLLWKDDQVCEFWFQKIKAPVESWLENFHIVSDHLKPFSVASLGNIDTIDTIDNLKLDLDVGGTTYLPFSQTFQLTWKLFSESNCSLLKLLIVKLSDYMDSIYDPDLYLSQVKLLTNYISHSNVASIICESIIPILNVKLEDFISPLKQTHLDSPNINERNDIYRNYSAYFAHFQRIYTSTNTDPDTTTELFDPLILTIFMESIPFIKNWDIGPIYELLSIWAPFIKNEHCVAFWNNFSPFLKYKLVHVSLPLTTHSIQSFRYISKLVEIGILNGNTIQSHLTTFFWPRWHAFQRLTKVCTTLSSADSAISSIFPCPKDPSSLNPSIRRHWRRYNFTLPNPFIDAQDSQGAQNFSFDATIQPSDPNDIPMGSPMDPLHSMDEYEQDVSESSESFDSKKTQSIDIVSSLSYLADENGIDFYPLMKQLSGHPLYQLGHLLIYFVGSFIYYKDPKKKMVKTAQSMSNIPSDDGGIKGYQRILISELLKLVHP